MRIIFAGLLASSVATMAHAQPAATKWYLIHPQEAKCMPSDEVARRVHAPAGLSPFAWAATLRKDGSFKTQDIERDEAGKVTSVEITSVDDVSITFYATKDACAADLLVLMNNGTIANPDELK